MAKLLVLNGPNLNLLGQREPDIYGRVTLAEINAGLVQQAEAAGYGIKCMQSNAEHELLAAVQAAGAEGIDFILINPAAFSHTSVALRDALTAVAIPFIELHLSNPQAREPFRRHSYFSDLAIGTITGFGAQSYHLALQAALKYLSA